MPCKASSTIETEKPTPGFQQIRRRPHEWRDFARGSLDSSDLHDTTFAETPSGVATINLKTPKLDEKDEHIGTHAYDVHE